MNLYEISSQYQEVLNGDPDTGEIDEEKLNALNDQIEDKADNYAKYIANIQGDLVAVNAEIERLQKRKTSIQNKVKYLKQNLQNSMIATGKTKFKTDLFSFSVVKNGGKTPLVFTGDVPKSYSKVKYDPDTEKIREALDAGKKLKFAEYGEKGEHLNIR